MKPNERTLCGEEPIQPELSEEEIIRMLKSDLVYIRGFVEAITYLNRDKIIRRLESAWDHIKQLEEKAVQGERKVDFAQIDKEAFLKP